MGNKRGLLFIGLCGHLSTVAMAGAMAIANKICPPHGNDLNHREMQPYFLYRL